MAIGQLPCTQHAHFAYYSKRLQRKEKTFLRCEELQKEINYFHKHFIYDETWTQIKDFMNERRRRRKRGDTEDQQK